MSEEFSLLALRDLLDGSDVHAFLSAADRLRHERFGHTASFAVIGQLDLDSGRNWCPVTGIEAPAPGFARSLAELSDELSDLILLVAPRPTLDQLGGAWKTLPPRPAPRRARSPELVATVQLGCSSDWIQAIDGAGADDVNVLAAFGAEGLHVISDGIRPDVHPAFGAESSRRWERLWRAASVGGIRGHTVVLYGPEMDLDHVLEQIEIIGRLQDETGVFLSVAPVIYSAEGHGGPADALLTQAMLDLKVLAACRLGLPQVPHVRLCTERSDLKSAHLALRCGADALEGPLFLGQRTRKDDAEAEDLSLHQIQAWLAEAGFEPRRRNALFESVPA